MRIRELSAEEAGRPLGWRYPKPYSVYDVTEELGGDRGFFAVESDDGMLVGFACVGAEARVPGVDEEPGTTDVGYGMRPDLVGQGRGREFVGAILAHVIEADPSSRLRMSILRWNARSRSVAEAHGFTVAKQVGDFDVLERQSGAPDGD